MQMAGPDIVLFVVGALLFGGATYAIVEDGGFGTSTSALGVFDVTFPTRTSEVGDQAVSSFRSASAQFDVTALNVTSAIVTIACNDAAGAVVPFTLQVEVEGPNGIAAEPTSGACGQALVIPLDVADVPPSTVVRGATEDEARMALPTFENASRAVGTWTVTVSGARGASPLPVGDPGGSIVLEVEQWEPTFAPVQV